MHARGFEVFDYGNFEGTPRADLTDTVKHGWYTYEHTPRYGTNYYGMRGRVSILSEAYLARQFQAARGIDICVRSGNTLFHRPARRADRSDSYNGGQRAGSRTSRSARG